MKYLLNGSLYISFLTFIALPFAYLIRLLLAKNLTIEEFGFLFAIIGFLDFIQSINDFGFSEAQVYFLPKYLANDRLDKMRAAIKAQLINQTLTTLIIAVVLNLSASWLATNFFHYPQGENIIRMMVLYFVAKGFLLNIKNVFFSFREVKIFAPQEALRMVLMLLFIGFSIFFFKLDLVTVSWIWIVTYAILAIYYSFYFFKHHRDVVNAPKYSLKMIYKEFVPYLIPTLLSNNLGMMYEAGGETLLVTIKGVSQVGLYNIAKPISNLAMAFIVPVASLLKPYVSEISEKKDKTEIKGIILMILNTGSFLLLPLVATLVMYSKESIIFLFGSQFIGASPALQIISIDIFFLAMSNFVFGIVFGLGLQKKRAKLIFFCSLINFTFAFFLIQKFGFIGLAFANLSYSVSMVVGALIFIYREVPFRIPVANYLKILLALLMYIGIQLSLRMITTNETLSQLPLFIIKITLGLIIYYSVGIKVLKIINMKIVGTVFGQAILPITEKSSFAKKILSRFNMIQSQERK